jgi:hypothetical protein
MSRENKYEANMWKGMIIFTDADSIVRCVIVKVMTERV